MRTNSTITIFNRKRNYEGEEELIPTVIHGCSWFEAKESASGRYADNADRFAVRIPITARMGSKKYIDKYDFMNMPYYEALKYWTLQKEDIVVRCAYFPTGVIKDSAVVLQLSDEVFLINSYADNTIRGTRAVKHWRIGGS